MKLNNNETSEISRRLGESLEWDRKIQLNAACMMSPANEFSPFSPYVRLKQFGDDIESH